MTEVKDKELVEFAQQAIRIPSFSGQEKEKAQFFQKKMLQLGFDSAEIDRYGSVVGTINGNKSGKTILMDGHIDHVDVIDKEMWKHDPFAAQIEDGKIYGRASSDMVASLCSMVLAASRFAKSSGKNFAGKICVSGSVHEECFEGVACREISKAVKPDYVIIGEATTTTVKIGQRGRAEVVVETEGKSCHSSNPEKGINAVYHMMALVEEIRKIKPNHHSLLADGILELTDIKSFPYPGASVVPSKCVATFDRRTLVGEDENTILSQVQEAIDKTKILIPDLKAKVYLAQGEAKCWTGETIKAKRYFPAWAISKDHPLVQKALAGLEKAGIKAEISHFAFCTNASHFCGEANIPSIGYGPSLESLAHVRDEYIEIEQLEKSCKGFESILSELTK